MSNNNNNLEVYTYRGDDGEKVPETVEKLIVKEGIRILPDELCCYSGQCLQEIGLPNGLIKIGDRAFCSCSNLLEITICSTMQYIGENSFRSCILLAKLNFEFSTSSPHQLERIGRQAFYSCRALLRIKLPASVNVVGRSVFGGCAALIEANLSTTRVTEIPHGAFHDCTSLQTISLPKTLNRITRNAFQGCKELVTVVVPLDSDPIMVGSFKNWTIVTGNGSFLGCKRLANLVLPEGSIPDDDAFSGCDLLIQQYGEDSSQIVAGLVGRFKNFPIHRMCYDHSVVTVQELKRCVTEQQEGEFLLVVDEFGMTAFHILLSTVDPRIELLEVLLDSLPSQILKYKDANGKRRLDYLINNWTDGSKRLCQRTLEKSMIERVARWGATSWTETMQSKIQDILVEDDTEGRKTLCDEVYSALEHYENVQASSMLEMALWKGKLKSGWTRDGSKRQALDRGECRCLNGSDVVIPNVLKFLDIARP